MDFMAGIECTDTRFQMQGSIRVLTIAQHPILGSVRFVPRRPRKNNIILVTTSRSILAASFFVFGRKDLECLQRHEPAEFNS